MSSLVKEQRCVLAAVVILVPIPSGIGSEHYVSDSDHHCPSPTFLLRSTPSTNIWVCVPSLISTMLTSQLKSISSSMPD